MEPVASVELLPSGWSIHVEGQSDVSAFLNGSSMARLHTVQSLPAALRQRVDTLIRECLYGRIDHMREILSSEGIEVSRSSLHRYAASLREKDGQFAGSDDRTVVVLMDRQTGGVTSFTTSASTEVLTQAINELSRTKAL